MILAGELRFEFVLTEINKPEELSECLGLVGFRRYWIGSLWNVHNQRSVRIYYTNLLERGKDTLAGLGQPDGQEKFLRSLLAPAFLIPRHVTEGHSSMAFMSLKSKSKPQVSSWMINMKTNVTFCFTVAGLVLMYTFWRGRVLSYLHWNVI